MPPLWLSVCVSWALDLTVFFSAQLYLIVMLIAAKEDAIWWYKLIDESEIKSC